MNYHSCSSPALQDEPPTLEEAVNPALSEKARYDAALAQRIEEVRMELETRMSSLEARLSALEAWRKEEEDAPLLSGSAYLNWHIVIFLIMIVLPTCFLWNWGSYKPEYRLFSMLFIMRWIVFCCQWMLNEFGKWTICRSGCPRGKCCVREERMRNERNDSDMVESL